MSKIKIEITKSKIESFTVSFEDEKINISTTIGLYTDTDRKISSFSLSSTAWNEENKIEVPFNCIIPIKNIAEELEIITTLKCREGQLMLE